MKTKIILITNKNSWAPEPIIRALRSEKNIEVVQVILLDVLRNRTLLKRRIRQYGLRKLWEKGIEFVVASIRRFLPDLIFKAGSARHSKEMSAFQLVKEIGMPYTVTSDLNAERTIKLINQSGPDIVFVCSCSQILKKRFLLNENIQYINFHDSLLPSHQGPSPSFWVLYHGETVSGYTIHRLSSKIDQGEILFQQEMPIDNIRSEKALIKHIFSEASDHISIILIAIQNNSLEPCHIKARKATYEGIPSDAQRNDLRKRLRKDE